MNHEMRLERMKTVNSHLLQTDNDKRESERLADCCFFKISSADIILGNNLIFILTVENITSATELLRC